MTKYHFTEEELQFLIFTAQCEPDWDFYQILELIAKTFNWQSE